MILKTLAWRRSFAIIALLVLMLGSLQLFNIDSSATTPEEKYLERMLATFEGGSYNDSSDYGFFTYTSTIIGADRIGYGVNAYTFNPEGVNFNNVTAYRGLYCVQLWAKHNVSYLPGSGPFTNPASYGAEDASLIYHFNISRQFTFLIKKLSFHINLENWVYLDTDPLPTTVSINLTQYDNTSAIVGTDIYDITNYGKKDFYLGPPYIIGSPSWRDRKADWQEFSIEPNWYATTTRITISFNINSFGNTPGGYTCLSIDNFHFITGEATIRIRFWNLYTGFGYYGEKLRCQYAIIAGTWTDVWQNEFTCMDDQEPIVRITDIFGRDIWTGIVTPTQEITYLDILVPIVTVEISKPSNATDSLPWEWSVTCLPYGPAGAVGTSVPIVGYEFEILAGWYSISWLQTQMYEAGNRTIYIDGNATDRKSYMITDLTLTMKPEPIPTPDGDKNRTVLNALDPSNWPKLIITALQEPSVSAAVIIGSIISIALGLYANSRRLARQSRASKIAEEAARKKLEEEEK